jgi:hypothetical protein
MLIARRSTGPMPLQVLFIGWQNPLWRRVPGPRAKGVFARKKCNSRAQQELWLVYAQLWLGIQNGNPGSQNVWRKSWTRPLTLLKYIAGELSN